MVTDCNKAASLGSMHINYSKLIFIKRMEPLRLAHMPPCLPPHAHPLLLLQQAPLHIFPLTHTCPAPLHLHIPPQALCSRVHFYSFLLLHSAMHLHLLLVLVLGPPVSKVLGLKYCPIPSHILFQDSPTHSLPGLPHSTC